MLFGLDEFMLRLGHLKVMCNVACEVGSSWFRIERETAKALTQPVRIASSDESSIAQYLKKKRLCPSCDKLREKPNREVEDFRYPALCFEEEGEDLILRSAVHETQIWWQDWCLADNAVRSRVGAITVDAKAGSKTGISHVIDWAQLVNLITRAGDVSSIGRLITNLSKDAANPYVINFDAIPLAYVLLDADFDMFSRFAPNLLRADVPIRKRDATTLFATTLSELALEAREARYLSTGRKNVLYKNMRDLEGAARRAKKNLDATSTAWHRASSRLETYVDIGMLEKTPGGAHAKFEYVYYPTDALTRAVSTLEKAKDQREWLERHLIAALFASTNDTTIAESELVQLLPEVIATLSRPTGPLPIETLCLGIAWIFAERRTPISLFAVRESIERLAHQRSDLARLSRGAFGDRAEFISIDIRELEKLKI